MTDTISKKNKRDQRNAKRRKRRLDQHSGIDWIDPEQGYGKVRGEQALWRAVILQMLEDATNHSKKPQDKFARTQARNWLEGTHRDFAIVCDLAGFDISYVRKKVKQALQNHHLWRKRPTNTKQIEKKPELENTKQCTSAANSKALNKAEILPFSPFFRKSA